MWDAYVKMDGLLKHKNIDEKTAKSLEGPLESLLASLQVRMLFYDLVGIHLFLCVYSLFLSSCLHHIRPGHYARAQYSLRRPL